MILAGDIGGTKTTLALFTQEGAQFRPLIEKRFESRQYRSLRAIVGQYISETQMAIEAACFGVAGPVIQNRASVTNLPWEINADSLAKHLGLSQTFLINDLVANAYGIDTLPDEDFVSLNDGEKVDFANRAVISAGTGLGEAFMVWDRKRYRASASEGGHTDFGPRTELEIELLRFLDQKYGRVSYERVVSGPGLRDIYEFLKGKSHVAEPAWLQDRLVSEDQSAVISEVAMAGKFELCVEALDLFVSLYGAEAGNLALKTMALAGVYVGGGIAPKILPKLKDGTFMKNFTGKGRFTELVSNIPVKVILNRKAALFGAARFAQFMVIEGQ